MADLIALTVNGDSARAADVDHTQFATFQEIGYAKLFTDFTADGDRFCHRHNAADDDAVNVAVNHRVFVSHEHFLNQKLLA